MVRNEIWDGSDHIPLLVDLIRYSQIQVDRDDPRIFLFEAKRLHEENFKDVIHDVWEKAYSNVMYGDLCGKLSECGEQLQVWDKGDLCLAKMQTLRSPGW